MSLVHCHDAGSHLELSFDDGKVNALSLELLEALLAAIEPAAAQRKALLISGRSGCLSAGYHLPTMRAGGEPKRLLRAAGDRLKLALLQHPAPVLIACAGHALAKGALLLLCADYRLGVAGEFRIGLNEVAIGVTLPLSAMTLARHRLSTAWLTRSVLNAQILTPPQALEAGYLDQVCAPEHMWAEARAQMQRLVALDKDCYAEAKALLRQTLIEQFLQAQQAEA